MPFSVRSERQLMAQMNDSCGFAGSSGRALTIGSGCQRYSARTVTSCRAPRCRAKIMTSILAHREVPPLLSDSHFSVDRALVKASALMKSFFAKAEPPKATHGRDERTLSAPCDEVDPINAPGPERTFRPVVASVRRLPKDEICNQTERSLA